MKHFDESDFAPLDDFPLLWRWTQASHTILPPDAMASIRPLGASAAARWNAEAIDRCISTRVRNWPHNLDVGRAVHESVGEWLMALGIEPGTRIIVSWDEATAVVTTWRTFAAHWSDFCYPGSDDVSIWAPDAAWTLCFHHGDWFDFSPSRWAV
jgi:hypothetical protein